MYPKLSESRIKDWREWEWFSVQRIEGAVEVGIVGCVKLFDLFLLINPCGFFRLDFSRKIYVLIFLMSSDMFTFSYHQEQDPNRSSITQVTTRLHAWGSHVLDFLVACDCASFCASFCDCIYSRANKWYHRDSITAIWCLA